MSHTSMRTESRPLLWQDSGNAIQTIGSRWIETARPTASICRAGGQCSSPMAAKSVENIFTVSERGSRFRQILNLLILRGILTGGMYRAYFQSEKIPVEAIALKLTDLLRYNDIVIQCHDKPDADTIASGYALLKYLRKQGKSPRLVYTGAQKLTRGSLDAMKNKFDIPLEYQTGPKEGEEAELLVTVDCRAGENNVSPLPYQNLAVIDHHSVKAEETLPELHEVRTEADGYASCATVLWAMLKEAGYPIEEDDQLPTIEKCRQLSSN